MPTAATEAAESCLILEDKSRRDYTLIPADRGPTNGVHFTGTVAGIQFFIGRKQAQAALTSANAALMNAQNAGRHTVAEFRQKWIDNVIDTLCEHESIATMGIAGQLSSDQVMKLTASRTKLGILLNPDETDTIDLLKCIDEIVESKSIAEADPRSVQMVTVARRLLKREWVRIKDELK